MPVTGTLPQSIKKGYLIGYNIIWSAYNHSLNDKDYNNLSDHDFIQHVAKIRRWYRNDYRYPLIID